MSVAANTAPAPESRLAQLATAAGVGVGLTLVAAKTWAWLASGSVAMLGSLADSGLDLVASTLIFSAVLYARAPADHDHRFGHAKAEAVAALVQVVLILMSALFVAVQSIQRLIAPAPVEHSAEALFVIAVSVALTIALTVFQTFALKRTGSVAIEADRAHYMSDLAGNLLVVGAIIASAQFGWHRADAVAGLLTAAFIGYAANGVFRNAFPQLMDQELPDEDRRAIAETVLEDGAVEGLHALRTRRAGAEIFIMFHLELDPEMPLKRAHAIAEAAERRLRARFPHADIVIHQDPAGLRERHDAYGRTRR